MTPNFSLWNVWDGKSGTVVTFFATTTGLQRINKGDHEMIAEMLSDLKIPKDKVKDWKVRPFATDYLSDDLDSKDWEDRWQPSYEVTVQMSAPVKFKPSARPTTGTLASDETWDDDEPVPPTCTVVVDFKREADQQRFDPAVKQLSKELTVERGKALDRQILVSMPAGAAFFKKGAKLAVSVERLAHEFGGTTQWRDRYGEEEDEE